MSAADRSSEEGIRKRKDDGGTVNEATAAHSLTGNDDGPRIQPYNGTINGQRHQLTDGKENRRRSIDGYLPDGTMLDVANVANLTVEHNHKDGLVGGYDKEGDMKGTLVEGNDGILFDGVATNRPHENDGTKNSAFSIRTFLVLLVFGVCAVIYAGMSCTEPSKSTLHEYVSNRYVQN